MAVAADIAIFNSSFVSSSIINSSSYHFCILTSTILLELRQELIAAHKSNYPNLKGTILLTPEGVNVRLSGTSVEVHSCQKQLRELHPNLSRISFRDVIDIINNSPCLPRFLVKIKTEVVSMGLDASVGPASHPDKDHFTHISAKQLNDLIDGGNEDVVMLDTRNDYEFLQGTFPQSVVLPKLQSFRDFPSHLTEAMKNRTLPPPRTGCKIVQFCTGGVRCEKSSIALEKEGYSRDDILQLDGGVLKYFQDVEKQGLENKFQGDLFVYDDRVCIGSDCQRSEKYTCCEKCRFPYNTANNTVDANGTEVLCTKCSTPLKLSSRNRNLVFT